MAEIYLDGAWRTPREVYLDGAWRSLEDIYLDGAWRGAGGGPAAPPSSLVATDWSACENGFARYRVRLSWLNGDATASTRVYRNGALQTEVGAGETQAIVTVGSAGTWSGWTVRHVKNGIESGNSNAASTTVSALNCSEAPTNFQVQDTSQCTEYRALLTWDNYDPAWTTRIYRDGVLVHTAAAGLEQWEDTGLSGATHEWYLTHVKTGGFEETAATPTIQRTLEYDCAGPAGAPSGVSLTDQSTCIDLFTQTADYQVRVTWDNGDPLAETRIYRNGSLIGQVAAGVTQYTDTTLTAPGSYTYKARHYLNSIESADSNAPTINLTNPCAP